MTIIGILSMIAGYYLALKVSSPMDAIGIFFIAVILVIVGTYALFTAGSIAFLKLLRKNKHYYYKTNHFVSVSSMIYRMKQNAVGLANICILSTMVLVVLSSTVSLYGGLEDALNTQFIRQVQTEVDMEDLGQKEAIQKDIQEAAEKTEDKISDLLSYYYFEEYMLEEDGHFQYQRLMTMDATDYIVLIPESQYEQISGMTMDLNTDEVYYYTENAKKLDSVIQIMNMPLKVKGVLEEISNADSSIIAYDSYFIVASDSTVEQIRQEIIQAAQKEKGQIRDLDYTYYIGANVMKENVEMVVDSWNSSFSGNGYELGIFQDIYSTGPELKAMYGGFFFLGLFLGALFLMATVLIIYYKQISEGYEDQKRFEIMQKVGMNTKEVKQTIRSQVLIFFFLPLIASVIHMAFAFHLITMMFSYIVLSGTEVFITCTIISVIIVAIVYAIVYVFTSRTYYRIVKN